MSAAKKERFVKVLPVEFTVGMFSKEYSYTCKSGMKRYLTASENSSDS